MGYRGRREGRRLKGGSQDAGQGPKGSRTGGPRTVAPEQRPEQCTLHCLTKQETMAPEVHRPQNVGSVGSTGTLRLAGLTTVRKEK